MNIWFSHETKLLKISMKRKNYRHGGTYQELEQIKQTNERVKESYEKLGGNMEEAEQELKKSLKKAEQVALKQVQKEVDILLSSAGVKAKINPTIIRKVLSSIVKHVKEIYFSSNKEIEEKLVRQEITYEDCRRELRLCVLFNYWGMKKFEKYLELDEFYQNQVKKLVEEDHNLTGSERTIENLNRQVEKANKLMGKNKGNQ